MKIKNYDALAKTPLRRAFLDIAEAGLQAIDTEEVIRRTVRLEGNAIFAGGEPITLGDSGKLFIVGIGKCSLEAGRALEAILGERIAGGIVVDVHQGNLQKIRAFTGTHPFPSDQNVDATKAIMGLLGDIRDGDAVLFLISGGGSTLLCQPTNFTCQDESNLISCLMRAGADIREINTVRKHLSVARGGYLAKYAYPARSVALIFSDVPGDDIEFIASGPTVKDTTTIEDAKRVMEKYNTNQVCEFSPDSLIETPKEDKYFERIKNVLVVSNRVALDAMVARAKDMGFSPRIAATALQGEAKDVATQILSEIQASPPNTALFYGGETTVNVKGGGKGGRNQEFALAAVRDISPGLIIGSIASDGKDNTEYGGAFCDIMTKENALAKGIDPVLHLQEHRSYDFFSATGDYLLMGDTGSNVSDLIIALHSPD